MQINNIIINKKVGKIKKRPKQQQNIRMDLEGSSCK